MLLLLIVLGSSSKVSEIRTKANLTGDIEKYLINMTINKLQNNKFWKLKPVKKTQE